jgi:hypothetical protein
LTFENNTSGFRAAAATRIGAKVRQGADDGAQKLTTANGLPSIEEAKFCWVSSITPGVPASMRLGAFKDPCGDATPGPVTPAERCGTPPCF